MNTSQLNSLAIQLLDMPNKQTLLQKYSRSDKVKLKAIMLKFKYDFCEAHNKELQKEVFKLKNQIRELNSHIFDLENICNPI